MRKREMVSRVFIFNFPINCIFCFGCDGLMFPLSVGPGERERQAASRATEPVWVSVETTLSTDCPASSDISVSSELYCQQLKRCLWRNRTTNETFYPPLYCWCHWTPLSPAIINTTNFRWAWKFSLWLREKIARWNVSQDEPDLVLRR